MELVVATCQDMEEPFYADYTASQSYLFVPPD